MRFLKNLLDCVVAIAVLAAGCAWAVAALLGPLAIIKLCVICLWG